MENKKINITECYNRFDDTYSPKIVATLNGQYVMVVKLEGDKVPWHTHDAEDELFWVIEGTLDIFEQGRTITLEAGEFYIVPRGTEHRVTPRGKVKLVLIEPAGIKHTGNVESEITRQSFERLSF